MGDFGPFSVAPAVIRGLGGASFGSFVNRLLSVEVARAGMTGTTLETTYLENVGDGGVDAALRQASATAWIPEGNSAWQFKAGDLAPAKCKTELKGATHALDILRNGGKYRLVLGVSLTSAKIASRRKALVEQAQELGLHVEADSFEIIGADGLARWAEEHPSLSVDPILGGIGTTCLTFHRWADSNRHTTAWVSSDERNAVIQELRALLAGGSQIDVHVDGVSGLGKTRLVMEALRGQSYEPLVIYVPAADQFTLPLLNQLTVQGRTAVLVIDECDRKQHEIYAGSLPSGTKSKLVTIGEPGVYSTRSPMIGLAGFEDGPMTELLETNVPNLWSEAVRVVVEVSAGNVDYALKAASAILSSPTASAATLVTGDDVRAYITRELPDGDLFLGCTILALFSRFGYDRDVARELEVIAQGFDIPPADLKASARALQGRGLLSKQGRFRSVGPFPLAVYLAASAWDEFGEQIIRDLIPILDDDLVQRLFRRASDIGEFASSSPAVRTLLAPTGPFAALESLAEGANSKLLVHAAVIAPNAIARQIAKLILDASEEELQAANSIRRDLVWTLEKLAWRSQTFELAAEALARLAVVETEKYSNNATGTWVALFGTMLPGTAASPENRISYLQGIVTSTDSRMRRMVVKAASHAISVHESIMVSGELQGGNIVEPRGVPKTNGEMWNYRKTAIDLLRRLADDSDLDVSQEALQVLAEIIHPLLEQPQVLEHFTESIGTLSASQLRGIRTEISSLKALFGRVSDASGRLNAVRQLEESLPDESASEQLWVLARAHPWHGDNEDLRRQISDAIASLPKGSEVEVILELLVEEVPAAFELGRALAGLRDDSQRVRESLLAFVNGPNLPAVVGYLWAKTEAGETAAFDSFIDQSPLNAVAQLKLTVRGPKTARAQKRIDESLGALTVRDGAQMLFGWLQDPSDSQLESYLTPWMSRMRTQEDYNAVVDFLALHLHDSRGHVAIDHLVRDVVGRRAEFPRIGQQSWDWAQLALRLTQRDPYYVAKLLLDLIEADAVVGYESSHEYKVLRAALKSSGSRAWSEAMNRIEAGSWRLALTARGWLAAAVDLETAKNWVAGRLDRARLLASVASIGDNRMSDIGRYLLINFGSDRQVSSALASEFISGSWTGNESDRISRQIEQLAGWLKSPHETKAVKAWISELMEDLVRDKERALEREAEETW